MKSSIKETVKANRQLRAGTNNMNRQDVTEMIMTREAQEGPEVGDIAKKIGHSKEWVTAAMLGQMTLTKAEAEKAGKLFGLTEAAC